jgi:hypothetical protein
MTTVAIQFTDVAEATTKPICELIKQMYEINNLCLRIDMHKINGKLAIKYGYIASHMHMKQVIDYMYNRGHKIKAVNTLVDFMDDAEFINFLKDNNKDFVKDDKFKTEYQRGIHEIIKISMNKKITYDMLKTVINEMIDELYVKAYDLAIEFLLLV